MLVWYDECTRLGSPQDLQYARQVSLPRCRQQIKVIEEVQERFLNDTTFSVGNQSFDTFDYYFHKGFDPVSITVASFQTCLTWYGLNHPLDGVEHSSTHSSCNTHVSSTGYRTSCIDMSRRASSTSNRAGTRAGSTGCRAGGGSSR